MIDTTIKPLRKCTQCGLMAFSKSELDLFVISYQYKFNRKNICKKCKNMNNRLGGKNYLSKKARNIKNHKNRLSFKGTQVIIPKNFRRNICQNCGKSYPETLKTQTCLHHIKYDADNPTKYTLELCRSCHAKLHHNQISEQKRVNPMTINIETDLCKYNRRAP